ncbi:nucleotide-binding domain-containing protein [Terfezia boudieri ATCC MYA-4762]|uniref:Nucleotide-binding domain-containing protein n=1 Tax=Terfezia boudieri ATCC MYA-4762 TaxID=1051890 RepID=A0A3N4M6B4_9PEZI|nr:nucleotide-binding domain-containing protein [Terfezia boudieri ATCC MYA-4762]
MANIAGVAGLTTALTLARTTNHKITVHMPGDYDIEYTSPWAGTNCCRAVSARNTPAAEWDRVTFKELWRLAKNAPEAGIHVQDMIIYSRIADAGKFCPLSSSELPPDVDSGIRFKSVYINTALYLPHLTSQCLAYGIVFKRAVLTHILGALSFHHLAPRADLIVNCTGLLASNLGGQIVVVRNTTPAMYIISGIDSSYDDECMYIMTRAAGGGTVLGGSYEKEIMKRAIRYCPELVKPGYGIEDLDVVRHCVGLRPSRVSEPRLELEKKVWDGWEGLGEVRVVHNYGAGGFGYQASYGMAENVSRLAEESLAEAEFKTLTKVKL